MCVWDSESAHITLASHHPSVKQNRTVNVMFMTTEAFKNVF